METEGEMARQCIAEVVFIYEGISAISDVLRMHKDKEKCSGVLATSRSDDLGDSKALLGSGRRMKI